MYHIHNRRVRLVCEMEETIKASKVISNHELRIHDLENEYTNLSQDIKEIKKVIDKIYLLGWGCFVTVLGWLGMSLIGYITSHMIGR